MNIYYLKCLACKMIIKWHQRANANQHIQRDEDIPLMVRISGTCRRLVEMSVKCRRLVEMGFNTSKEVKIFYTNVLNRFTLIQEV